LAISKSPGDPNVPPRSLHRIIDASYLAGELVDCPDEAFIDISLRDLPLRLAQEMLYACSGLPHDRPTQTDATNIRGITESFSETSR
jgi:hypothetical protein